MRLRVVDRPPDQAFEAGAALALRLATDVFSLDLQKVVDDEGDGQLPHRLLAHDLAPQPLLETGEGRKPVERIGGGVAQRRDQHHELAVERDARRQGPRQRLEIRVGLGDQLLAARPQPPGLAAPEELRADAVELPFDDPVRRRPERLLHGLDRPLPGLRQIEGIGPAGVERRGLRMLDLGDQRAEIVWRGGAPRLRIADHALRHAALLEARHLGQRLDDLQPRHADAQLPGDELEEDEALVDRQLGRPSPQPRVALLLVERGQRQKAVPHPDVERNLLAFPARGQEKRQRLGEIADARIALLAKPLGQPRPLDRESPQETRRNRLPRLAAGEEIDHPGRARPLHRVVLGGCESADERGLFGPGRSRGVELTVKIGEGFHGATRGDAAPLPHLRGTAGVGGRTELSRLASGTEIATARVDPTPSPSATGLADSHTVEHAPCLGHAEDVSHAAPHGYGAGLDSRVSVPSAEAGDHPGRSCETKMAPNYVRMAVGSSGDRATSVVSRLSGCNLSLTQRHRRYPPQQGTFEARQREACASTTRLRWLTTSAARVAR